MDMKKDRMLGRIVLATGVVLMLLMVAGTVAIGKTEGTTQILFSGISPMLGFAGGSALMSAWLFWYRKSARELNKRLLADQEAYDRFLHEVSKTY